MNKTKTTLLVTDSGLGGLSVFADIAGRMEKNAPVEQISLVYFNAWPFEDKGYNHLPDMAEKAMVFNNAMEAMAEFSPDAILIVCNTLSVIYPFTPFSRTGQIRVTGIVDHGVDLIYDHLVQTPDSRVVIFATPTTIGEQTHEKALVNLGIAPGRIVTQGCIDLAGKIERDPFSPDVFGMIDANARQAALKLGPSGGNIFAALCCTHFGYCSQGFASALEKHTRNKIFILNPNIRMAQAVFDKHSGSGFACPEITMKIVSRVCWDEARINSYEKLLKPVSPRTVDALKRYTWDKDLFQVT